MVPGIAFHPGAARQLKHYYPTSSKAPSPLCMIARGRSCLLALSWQSYHLAHGLPETSPARQRASPDAGLDYVPRRLDDDDIPLALNTSQIVRRSTLCPSRSAQSALRSLLSDVSEANRNTSTANDNARIAPATIRSSVPVRCSAPTSSIRTRLRAVIVI